MESLISLHPEITLQLGAYLPGDDLLSLACTNKGCRSLFTPQALSLFLSSSKYMEENLRSDRIRVRNLAVKALHSKGEEPYELPASKSLDIKDFLVKCKREESRMLRELQQGAADPLFVVNAFALCSIGVMDLPLIFLSPLMGGQCLIDYYAPQGLSLHYRQEVPIPILYQDVEFGNQGSSQLSFSFNFNPFMHKLGGFIILTCIDNIWHFEYQD